MSFCAMCAIGRSDGLELCPHHLETSQNYVTPVTTHDSVGEAVRAEWALTAPKPVELAEDEFLAS